MKLIRRTADNNIADRWRRQYPTRTEVLGKIQSAGDNCDLIDAAIGNKAWTTPYCDGCQEFRDVCVEFATDTHVCLACIAMAAQEYKLCPQPMEDEPETPQERKRYALLQASAKINCCDWTGDESDCVDRAVTLLAEIERRESK